MRLKKRHFYSLLVGGITLLFGLLGLVATPLFVDWSYDTLVSTVGGASRTADPRVVLLLIDEDSLAYGEQLGLGRWPWPRSIYPEILDFINRTDPPAAIFFDILFPESDPRPGNDEAFAAAIAASGNVVHNMLFDLNPERSQALPLPEDAVRLLSLPVSNAHAAAFAWNRANQFTLPVARLRSADAATPLALGLAVADFKPDGDGVYRRGRMLFRYGEGETTAYFPSLSLKAAQVLAGNGPLTVAGRRLHLGGLSIPVDARGECLVNYVPGGIETFSMSALLESAYYLEQGEADKMRINPAVFKDKIVIIGVSAVGGQDLKNTPLSPVMPGPAIHANLISDILQDNHITREPLWLSWFLLLLVSGLAIGAVFYVKSAVGQILSQAAILVGYIVLAVLAFRFANYLSALFVVATAGFVGSGVSYIYKSMTEGAEKRKYSKILGNLIDPQIVREALVDLDALKRGGEMEITAFFSDVASFSTISEKLNSIELAALLNEYLSAMTVILKKHGGTLDKYIGDAVVGIFGAPVPAADTELAAAHASLEMLDELEVLRARWKEADAYCPEAHEMHFRIGLNSGPAKVGFMGTDTLASYTMMGDTVNLAARLEAAGKDYGVATLVSEAIEAKVRDVILVRKLDMVRVKGKLQPVTLYELVGYPGKVPEKRLEANAVYEKAFNTYLERDFDKAIALLGKAAKIRKESDRAIDLLKARCILYKQSAPPANWDGVFTRTSK